MKIMLTGANGQVGTALQESAPDFVELACFNETALDLTNADQVAIKVNETNPDIIINAAAYTAVDKAEDEPDVCHAVNAHAVTMLQQQACKTGAVLVHYSTDYVYDGNSSRPYKESNKTNPLGVYGKTKLEGDQLLLESDVPALIFRTSWVYSNHGHNFYLTMRRLLQEREELNIVSDQIGAPTSANAIARASWEVLSRIGNDSVMEFFTKYKGVYHMTCQGQTSWYGFTEAIRELSDDLAQPLASLSPIKSSEYPVKAKRPAYSVLDNSLLKDTFSVVMPDWKAELERIVRNPDG